MKKIIAIILITVIIIFTFSGCSKTDNNTHKFYSVDEWISPDGVHYWIYIDKFYTDIGISPRYDKNGDLFIDR